MKHRTQFARGLFLIAIVGSSLLPSAGGKAEAGTFSNGTAFLRRFSPAFMATKWPSMTTADAQAIARRFDLIVSAAAAFRGFLPAMKSANPNLTLLAYVNGTFSMNESGNNYPASWYAHDSNGKQITSTFGNYLMDVSRSEWRNAVLKRCQSLVASDTADGCFLDTMGTAIFTPGYVSGIPINPSTGSQWTASGWLTATTSEASFVRNTMAPKPLMVNGLNHGATYFDNAAPTKRLLSGSDAGMVELFIRPPFVQPSQYRPLDDWKKDVDMVVDSASTTDPVATVTKVWTSASQAAIDSVHRYALASFFLGSNGTQYFSFTSAHTWSGVTTVTPYDGVDIGSPLGAYVHNTDGTFQRSFSDGFAIVNPTSASVTRQLPQTYRTLDGATITRLTLPAHSGEILKNA